MNYLLKHAQLALISAVIRYWPFIAIVAAWWIWIDVNEFTATVAPTPYDVATNIFSNLDIYLPLTMWSAGFAIIGVVGGVLIGTLCGFLAWSSPLAHGLIAPTAFIARVTPIAAIIPIVARIVGYGDHTVLLLVVILTFFPSFSLTAAGLSSVPRESLDLARSFGATKWQTIINFHIPYAVPSLAMAVRISVPLGILSVLLAEYLMAGGGLGGLMRQATSYLDTQQQWGAAIVATVMSIASFGAARVAEKAIRLRFT